MNRRVKIVATVGPASMQEDVLRAMVSAGMDAMRINMSHSDYDEHMRKIEIWRSVAGERPIIADLTGPSIRTVLENELPVRPGDRIVIGKDFGTTVNISHAVVPGDTILVDDGTVRLEVENVEKGKIEAVVVVGGVIKPNKSVNIPGADVGIALPTDKDRQDMKWAVDNDVDIFFASFVNRKEDILAVREYLDELGSDAWVFAKIESVRGVENAKEILQVSDGIVVARGDLGVEMPVERVPAVQKELVHMARRMGKPVVVATQMLASMVERPYPTRAEVSDVANAIFDGASAVMVSNETAVGKHPVEVINVLRRIILANQDETDNLSDIDFEDDADAVANSAIALIERMGARFVVTPTSTGRSPRKIARFAPRAKILALTNNPRLLRKLYIVYGTEPRLVEDPTSFSTFVSVVSELRRSGRLAKGDAVVATNIAKEGGTHTLRVTRV